MTPDQITEARALVERLTGYTPGPWSGHNMVHEEGRQMTPVEIGEYVCNSVKMGDLSRFLFVSGKHDDGGDCDVCHTGNGPRGPANTALIAAAPDLLAALTAALDRAEKAEKMRDYNSEVIEQRNVMLARTEAERDTAWNVAIEAAARAQEYALRQGVNPEKHSDHIRNLKRGEPT